MSEKYNLNAFSKYSGHAIIARLIGKNKTILDVGCNKGYIGLIADSSNLFYGIDYSSKSLSEAKVIYKDVSLMDLNKKDTLPWNRKFDMVIMADVLEHLYDPDKILSTMLKKYLRSDGEVVISLPNVANWQIRLMLLFGRLSYTESGIMDKTHVHLYTWKTARKMVRDNRLEIISEHSGSNYFGAIIKYLPFLAGILSTNIIIVAKKE